MITNLFDNWADMHSIVLLNTYIFQFIQQVNLIFLLQTDLFFVYIAAHCPRLSQKTSNLRHAALYFELVFHFS